MEEQHAITTPDAPGGDDFGRLLREERSRVHEFVRGYTRQLSEIEGRIEAELAQVQQALRQADESQRHEAADRAAEWQSHREQLARLAERLEASRGEHAQRLEQLRGERQSLVDELVVRHAALERRGSELVEQEALAADRDRELARRQARYEAEQAEQAEQVRRLEARRQDVEREHAELLAGRERLAEQRRRVAEEFRDRRRAHSSELERRREEMDRHSAAQQTQFEQAASAARQERDALDQQLRQTRAERDSRRQELTETQRRHDALEQKLQALGASHDDLRQQLTDRQVKLAAAEQQTRELEDQSSDLLRQLAQATRRAGATAEQTAESDQILAQLTAQLGQARDQAAQAHAELNAAHEERARLRTEAVSLRERLAAGGAGSEEAAALKNQLADIQKDKQRLEEQLSVAEERSAQSAGDDTERADFESRLGMALDDLRAEKARNAELQRKLLSAAQSAPAPSGGGMDWESQKRRMLAALEADGDAPGPERAEERLKIDEAIRHSDRALAEKDSEIGELKKLLEEQSGNWGNVAVGAAAVADVLDKDEIVRQERASLQQLQNEWREKLRQAEVDISVERAKLARERADMEERLRHLEENQPRAADGKGSKPSPEKPQRGRWLARLGLKDQAEE